jgi:hypothetical protein
MGDTNACNQRQIFLMSVASLPKNRIEMQASPYVNPANTVSKLDMRRKAEILQHNKNASKVGGLSQSQKYANAINKNAKNAYNITTTCGSDLYLPSLSSSCDVPGPVITLQYDPTVPLYNYAKNTDAYGILEPDVIDKWVDKTKNNIPAYSTVETTFIDSLAIGVLDTNPTIFTIIAPIGIYVEGVATGASASGSIKLSTVAVTVYYNNQLVTLTSNPIIRLNGAALPQASTSQYTVDMSGPSFSGSQYIGNLSISNLVLPTQYGFVYTIKIKCTTTVTSQVGTYSSFKSGIVLNLTAPTVFKCSFATLSPTPPPQSIYALSALDV